MFEGERDRAKTPGFPRPPSRSAKQKQGCWLLPLSLPLHGGKSLKDWTFLFGDVCNYIPEWQHAWYKKNQPGWGWLSWGRETRGKLFQTLSLNVKTWSSFPCHIPLSSLGDTGQPLTVLPGSASGCLSSVFAWWTHQNLRRRQCKAKEWGMSLLESLTTSPWGHLLKAYKPPWDHFLQPSLCKEFSVPSSPLQPVKHFTPESIRYCVNPKLFPLFFQVKRILLKSPGLRLLHAWVAECVAY